MVDRDDQLMLVNDIVRSSNSKAAGLIKRIIVLMLGFKDYKLKRLSNVRHHIHYIIISQSI